MTEDEILTDCPDLTPDHIRAAVALLPPANDALRPTDAVSWTIGYHLKIPAAWSMVATDLSTNEPISYPSRGRPSLEVRPSR